MWKLHRGGGGVEGGGGGGGGGGDIHRLGVGDLGRGEGRAI